jgi:hypothetical protein
MEGFFMSESHRLDDLLAWAKRLHVVGIHTEPVAALSVPQQRRFVFRATVFTTKECKGFTGFGEADPASVPPELRGCELRIAETRALSRALRKAFALVGTSRHAGRDSHPIRERFAQVAVGLGVTPELLKAYAQVVCEAKSLRAAGPDRITSFLDHVEEQAKEDREQLLALIAQHAPTGGTQ